MSIKKKIEAYREAWKTAEGRRKAGNMLRFLSISSMIALLLTASAAEREPAIIFAVLWVWAALASALTLREARKMESKEAEDTKQQSSEF
jgi:hypothetical protein